jgi:hypothetical protein
MQARFFLAGILLFIWNCGEHSGRFGWATSVSGDLGVLERQFYVPTQFEMTREELYFSPGDTIHFVYEFDSSVAPTDEFLFSLNKKSIDYLEIDLRIKTIEEGKPVIRDHYTGLNVGEYLLKIAYEGEVFDTVEFQVLPDESYFVENLDSDGNPDTEDEIIRYSR